MDSSAGNQLVGTIGHLSMRIPGPGRPGEVLLSVRGGSEPFIAYSDEPVPAGSQVLVVASRPGRVVDVTAFVG